MDMENIIIVGVLIIMCLYIVKKIRKDDCSKRCNGCKKGDNNKHTLN